MEMFKCYARDGWLPLALGSEGNEEESLFQKQRTDVPHIKELSVIPGTRANGTLTYKQ